MNSTFNISNISWYSGQAGDICAVNGTYSAECLVTHFCPQIPAYFVNVGITLIITYIVSTWLLWAFWRYVVDKIDYTEMNPVIFKIVGDLRLYERKVYWQLFFNDKMLKLFLGYAVVLVYFFWKM